MIKRLLAVLFFVLSFTLLLWACTDKPDKRNNEVLDEVRVTTLASLETVTWQKLSDEKREFKVTGTQTVRYGLDPRWVEKQVTGTGWCGNWFFGTDPYPNKVKRCELKVVTSTPDPEPDPEPEPEPEPQTWTKIADEKTNFTLTATSQVRYGVDGRWLERTLAPGTYWCGNTFFGTDPASGTVKRCEVKSGTIVTPPPDPDPDPDPEPEPEPSEKQTVSYGRDTSNFANPERGFAMPIASYSNDIKDIRLDQIQSAKSQGISLINRRYVMVTFKNSSISQAYLDHIQRDFNLVRQHGMKMVIRFSYTFNEASTDGYADTNIAQMLRHVEQLKPVLQRNIDVLAYLEAGFIGRWGEWNKSTNRLGDETNPQNVSAQSQLVNALLNAVPKERMITLRYYSRKWAIFDSSATGESTSYAQSGEARVGHMNDYFTIDSYSGSARSYLMQDTLYTLHGGEPIKLNGSRSECPSTLGELVDYHWSTMNIPGSDFAAVWQRGGCYEDIRKRLGYRYYLSSATFPKAVNDGATLEVTFNMTNEGFARPYNPRGFEIVLRNRSTGVVSRLAANLGQDTRSFLPDPGRTETLTVRVGVPSGLAAGQYDLLLNLPDPAPSLNSRSEYSIRLASTGVWESATGMNRLGSLTVQ
jgi:hypothetical protein